MTHYGIDKFTAFGLGIHGEIDGCRREVLCLNVSAPKKDPAAIS